MSDVWARFVGVVEGGKLRPADTPRLKALMHAMEGRRVEMALRPEQQKRTLPQNAKLHVLAKAIAARNGDTLDDIKGQAVFEALGAEVALKKIHIRGQEHWIIRGTSSLLKDEGSLVMDWMLDKMAFLEVPTPDWATLEVMP